MSMDNSMMVFFLSMLATYSIVGFVWWLLHVVDRKSTRLNSSHAR